ncbi:related to transcription factor Pig1p [Rhynchosporium secalis]|uniref:Related to transcription factor Pig1p n=1 Tax=Rhynchosporium secalis TaxID=38038 RepID=A0A1E1MW35_RHYSE|nr:related to transcription factor Pig1p [Rhynchosporium secalis]
MIFCTYCGKSFTRKEHLERHIPSHTNVKPHRCTLCQLSFPRRDLLQRHHFTYHEAKDPMQVVPGTVPSIAGRTPIACINCANAKTGCDKAVPCSRCAEKNLPCEARFARRSGKASMRSASLSGVVSAHLNSRSPKATNRLAPKTATPAQTPIVATASPVESSQIQESPHKEQTQVYNMQGLAFGNTPFNTSPSDHITGIDTFMCLNDEDMLNVETSYQDLMMWNQCPSELEMYHPTMTGKIDCPFMEMAGSYSSSDALQSGSLHTSISIPHTGSTSISSQADFERTFHIVEATGLMSEEPMVPEFEVVIAAEAAWPLARCNRPIFSGSCPRTAIVHLENLEQHSRYENTWSLLDSSIDLADGDYKNRISVVPFSPCTRDRILAITQSFLHTALETHRGAMKVWDKGSPHGNFNFLVLPPSKILEYFLRNYVRSLAPYYILVNGNSLDPNELMLNNQASTLLLLLMIATGATSVQTSEARCLTAGLTETCRISLFNIIEKDVELSADPVVLRCALLFTILGAWSGDAWHMNIAMGQRGMYLSMLKHAGMLEPLVYNWVMVDQELSLFHDTAPILSITELQTPMPGMESLWLAQDSTEWLLAFQQTNSATGWMSPNPIKVQPLPPSLCDLFQDLLHDNINHRYNQLSPLQLKLLLHPLQSLLCHLSQVLSCFSDFFGARRGTRTVTKASTMLRMEEVQSLLQKWYELCAVHAKADPTCPVTQANLVLYHLISLNAVTSFPEIERLARKEAFDGSSRELANRYKKCIHQPEEVLIHCGQVLRIVSSMPREGRPHWWSTAIYRATLILWVESLSRVDPTSQRKEKGPMFAIDAVMPDDRSVVSYLWNGEGVPVLTKGDRLVELLPDEVLSYCIMLLEQGVALRICDGIKRKIQTLSRNWSSVLM